MFRPIGDLHCDLLLYLYGNERRTAYDRAVRCSIPQLREGHVVLQTLAIYSDTGKSSSKVGWGQADIFCKLPQIYPDAFEIIHSCDQLHVRQRTDRIGILPAFENASAFCEEEGDLDEALQKLADFEKKRAKVVYISLTWNNENRFGGGASTTVGLKDDGRRLLDFMHGRRIAVDLSHTSDPLAYGILEHIDRHKLQIPIIASHSNFRQVHNVSRNLPDDLAKEVIRRNGVIGMNFIRPFIGTDSFENWKKHFEYGLHLGGEEQLCFGGDFFYDKDLSEEHRKKIGEPFFTAFEDASCYPKIFEKAPITNQVAYCNLKKFLQAQIL